MRLAGGAALRADVVVSAVGHTDSLPDAASAAWAGFAARHGGFHAAPSYTTDVDYSAIVPGQDVIVSGMGLAFVDLLVLLMEGRGGRFEDTSDGGLEYLPSGAEPRIWAGSRRGVPYHSKISSQLRGEPAGAPRFFTAEAVDALLAGHGELDFRTQLWPLIAKDAGYGYYRELFTGYPERTSMGWTDFAGRFAAADWYSPDRVRLVAEAVPDKELHLDLEQLDRPFAGRELAGLPGVQSAVTSHIENDLRLRTGPDHSETLGLFTALLKVYMELGRLVPPERLNSRSQQTVHGWWHGFFSFVDSGPPPRRLREMLALHRAGVLRFIGPGLEITAEEASGRFVATSAQAGVTVHAAALIEARLPAPSVARSANPLLRQLSPLRHRRRAAAPQRRRPALHRAAARLGPQRAPQPGRGTEPPPVRRRARNVRLGSRGLRQARHQRGALPGKRRPGPAHPDRPGRAGRLFEAARNRSRHIRRQPPARERPDMNHQTIPAPALLNPATLTVLDLPMDDPRVRPLLDELAVEYDTRYAGPFRPRSGCRGAQPLPGRGIRGLRTVRC